MIEISSEVKEVVIQHDHIELEILSNRLKNWDPEIDTSKLKVLSMRPITWKSGSLGCEIPGKYYTQELVSGYLIWLKYDDDILEIHTDLALRSISMPGVGFI